MVKDIDFQGTPFEGVEGGTYTEEIGMPEDDVNEHVLTFALLSRPSTSLDPDLALAPKSGPKKKKRRSEGPKLEEDGADGDVDDDENSGSDAATAGLGTLSRRSVTMMVGLGNL